MHPNRPDSPPAARSWHVRPLAAVLLLGFLASLAVASTEAQATIPAIPRSWVWGPRSVWTNGTTTGVFHPLSGPIESAGLINVRTTFELSENYASLCKIRPALRYSDDGIVWAAAEEYPDNATYESTSQIFPGNTYVDITSVTNALPKAYVQFGLQVANTSAGAVAMCNVAMRVEPKERR